MASWAKACIASTRVTGSAASGGAVVGASSGASGGASVGASVAPAQACSMLAALAAKADVRANRRKSRLDKSLFIVIISSPYISDKKLLASEQATTNKKLLERDFDKVIIFHSPPIYTY
jgi:dihydrodipicolinate synthase/N-acetylneuraminate lyase